MPCRGHESKDWKAVDVDEDRLASYPLARLGCYGLCMVQEVPWYGP